MDALRDEDDVVRPRVHVAHVERVEQAEADRQPRARRLLLAPRDVERDDVRRRDLDRDLLLAGERRELEREAARSARELEDAHGAAFALVDTAERRREDADEAAIRGARHVHQVQAQRDRELAPLGVVRLVHVLDRVGPERGVDRHPEPREPSLLARAPGPLGAETSHGRVDLALERLPRGARRDRGEERGIVLYGASDVLELQHRGPR